MKKCLSGYIGNGLVPAITYCQLSLDSNNTRINLGYYANGFWVQNNVSSLPFLNQSYLGEYTSPKLNGR